MTAAGVIVLSIIAFLLGLTGGYITWGRYLRELEDELDAALKLLEDDEHYFPAE